MDPTTLPPVHVGKDVDYNKDKRTDLDEVRAKVAATFGVSTSQVKLELIQGDFQATILPGEGETEIIGKACIEWADYDDLQRLVPTDYAPVDAALSFGTGDGKTGPILCGRMVPAVESNKVSERNTVIPRFQAYLAREFKVPADQIELRLETDAQGVSSFSARKKGEDGWRKLEFVIPDASRPNVNEERDILFGAFKDLVKAKAKAGGTISATDLVSLPPALITVPEDPALAPPKTKESLSEPFPLSDLSTTISKEAQDQTIDLAPLPPNTAENPQARREALIKDLCFELGLKPEEAGRIVLKEMGGTITASVMPKSVFDQSMAKLSEAWKPETIIYLKPASPDDAAWLTKAVKQSASNLLIHLGGMSENPNKIEFKQAIPTENGPAAVADFFKNAISATPGLNGPHANIVVKFNEAGVLQAWKNPGKGKQPDKVYDIVIRDPYTRNFLLSMARDNPSERLSTFGESKWQTNVDLSTSTGFPNPKGATTFNQTLYSRYNMGQLYVGAGVQMKQGLTGFTDGLSNNAFAWQNVKLDLGHRQFFQTELEMRNSPDGPKFSLGGIKSNITEDWVKNNFVRDLRKGKGYAVLTTIGVVAAAGTTAVVLAGKDKETKIDLPIDGTVFDTGKFKMTGGVRGALLLGGEKNVGYTFKGARMGFQENFAPGTLMNQRFEYRQDHDGTQGGNLLNAQFDGTIKYRTSYSLTTSYRTNDGVLPTGVAQKAGFVDSRLSVSQSFALGKGMGLNINAAGSMNGQGKFHDPAFNAGWSYQRGQAWNFRLNAGTTQDINGAWKGYASAGVNLRF
jgi:hypothetical protein